MKMNLDPDEEGAEVADREGSNGLPFLSSGDPRTATGAVVTDKPVNPTQLPFKYVKRQSVFQVKQDEDIVRQLNPNLGSGVNVPFTLADGIEARLIAAEAALHHPEPHSAHPTWLRLLNQLRVTAPIPGTTRPNPAKLGPLIDPGTDSARIALVFTERAYWLFMTGHRQGDLRRLVRQYHRPQDQVYPLGPYILPDTAGTYGPAVNAPIPDVEKKNPSFHGCLDRDA
jgi:hypothetical protein